MTTFKQESIARFNTLQPAIDAALEHGPKYPWLEFIALKPLKVISDLVESVLGAIYLDTNGDFAQCEVFVEKLGLLKHMRRIMDDDVKIAFPKEQLGEIADHQTVEYVTGKRDDDDDGRVVWDCVVKVGGVTLAEARRCNGKVEAEATAAWKGIEVLEERLERTGSAREKKDGGVGEDEGAQSLQLDQDTSNDMDDETSDGGSS